MKPIWKAALIVFGLCVLTLKACALSGGPVNGVVIDETTGKPVADAIVVVKWRGSWSKIFAESSSGCYHVETARTDADGKFSTSAWVGPFSASDWRLTHDITSYQAYKPGYWRAKNRDFLAEPQKIVIVPFNGTKAEYFETVFGSASWDCRDAGGSAKNLYRLYKAMADEASALAETSTERGWIESLAKQADESLINRDQPIKYDENRRVSNVDPRDTAKKVNVPQ